MSQTKHLIYEYQNNDELDLDRIMNDFEPYIRTIINNMVMDNLSYEDKEEILSDAFFILWKNQNKVSSSIEAYIAGITRILVKEKLRKRKITYDIAEYENIASDLEISKEDIYESEVIGQYINKLKKVEIQIISLYYYHLKNTKEIAKELNVSDVQIKSEEELKQIEEITTEDKINPEEDVIRIAAEEEKNRMESFYNILSDYYGNDLINKVKKEMSEDITGDFPESGKTLLNCVIQMYEDETVTKEDKVLLKDVAQTIVKLNKVNDDELERKINDL